MLGFGADLEAEGRGPPSAAMVGRMREFDRVRAFLDRAAGAGDALLVLGDAGVGKTVTLNLAADLAAGDGMLVLRAAGVEFEADLPFAGLHQVLLPLLTELELLTAAQREALNVALGFVKGEPPARLVVSGATLGLLQQDPQEAAAGGHR